MNKFFLVIGVLSLFWACQENRIVFNDSVSLEGYWNADEPVIFSIPQQDSLKHYNLFLNLRNTNDYKYNNIFIITTMNFPNGLAVVDTLEYKMANPDGSWMGNGIGNVKENKLWYKEGVRFVEEGDYTFTVEQAMRNNGEANGVKKLEGIVDISFTVEEQIYQEQHYDN